MANGIKEPFQVTKHPRLVALEGNDPLAAAFLQFSRFVVCETIEQTGLKSIERRDRVGHSQRKSAFRFRLKNFGRPKRWTGVKPVRHRARAENQRFRFMIWSRRRLRTHHRTLQNQWFESPGADIRR